MNKMYTKTYKLITFLSIFVANSSFCYAASSSSVNEKALSSQGISKIDDMDRSWFSVLSGSPSSSPVQTNFGFLIVEDSKFLSSYSRAGQRLWQTNTGAKIKGITFSETEFIALTNQKNQLQLVNPSGLILWSKPLGFESFSEPFFGFDGRIFVRSKTQISCFGINGLQKWTLLTDSQQNLNPELLNDGSIIVFLEKTHDGKTCALRISPFGNILEKIVFQGKVVNAFTCTDGIILVFSTGEIGMCAIKTSTDKENGLIYSKWINKEVKCNEFSRSRKISSKDYGIFTPNQNFIIINTEKGTVKKSFRIPEITDNNYLYFETVDDKIIVAQSSDFVIYNTSGKKLKQLQMPSKSGKYRWDYACFINSGFATFLSKDWTVNSFKIISTSKEKISPTFSYYQSKNIESGYKAYIKNLDYKPEKSSFSPEVCRTLKKGNFGQKEVDISNIVNTVINSYFENKMTETVNRDPFELVSIDYNLADIENVLNIVPLLQSHYFQQKVALLLSVETDKTMIVKLLKTAGSCGYDPGGELLLQIEILVKHTSPKDHMILAASADAVYEICRFMGRPALLSKGKQILNGMFFPQYDETTKKAARNAMQKLAQLNM